MPTKKSTRKQTSVYKCGKTRKASCRHNQQTKKRYVLTGGLMDFLKPKKPKISLPEEQQTVPEEKNPIYNLKLSSLASSSSSNNEFWYLEGLGETKVTNDKELGLKRIPVALGLNINKAVRESENAKRAHENAKHRSMESLSKLYGYGEPRARSNTMYTSANIPAATIKEPVNTGGGTNSGPTTNLSKPETSPLKTPKPIQRGSELAMMTKQMLMQYPNLPPSDIVMAVKSLWPGEKFNEINNNTIARALHTIYKRKILKTEPGTPIGRKLNTSTNKPGNNNAELLDPETVQSIDIRRFINNPMNLLNISPSAISPGQLKYIPQFLQSYVNKNPKMSNNDKTRIVNYVISTVPLVKDYSKQKKFQTAASKIQIMTKAVDAFRSGPSVVAQPSTTNNQ